MTPTLFDGDYSWYTEQRTYKNASFYCSLNGLSSDGNFPFRGRGDNLSIFVTGVCGWEADPPPHPYPYSYNVQTEKTYLFI